MSQPLYTIGHSTRDLDVFLDLLREHGVERLVDVRRFPGSRRYPHFGSESLQRSLEADGIAYRHAPELGGRRKAAPDSPNTYWRNDSFRAYADYMATAEFQAAAATLLHEAVAGPTVIMCAEAVPWRCHRNLVSDAVVAAGIPVEHIIDRGKSQAHVLNPAVRLGPAPSARPGSAPSITYPAEGEEQGRLGL